MTDIVKLEDADGNVHYTARESQAAEQLIRDGAVDLDPSTVDTSTGQEVDDASSAPAGDHDSGTTDGRSGQRKRASRNADGGDGAGTAGSGSGS